MNAAAPNPYKLEAQRTKACKVVAWLDEHIEKLCGVDPHASAGDVAGALLLWNAFQWELARRGAKVNPLGPETIELIVRAYAERHASNKRRNSATRPPRATDLRGVARFERSVHESGEFDARLDPERIRAPKLPTF